MFVRFEIPEPSTGMSVFYVIRVDKFDADHVFEKFLEHTYFTIEMISATKVNDKWLITASGKNDALRTIIVSEVTNPSWTAWAQDDINDILDVVAPIHRAAIQHALQTRRPLTMIKALTSAAMSVHPTLLLSNECVIRWVSKAHAQ